MKKIMSMLLVIVVCCGLFAGCADSEKSEEKKNDVKVVEKEFQGITFNVPETWSEENSTETELFFYPENATFLVQFIGQTSMNMQDDVSVQQFIDGFGQSFSKFNLDKHMEENVAGSKALKFTSTFEEGDAFLKSTVVVVNHNGGLLSFMLATDSESKDGYDKEFDEIIKSVKNINGMASGGNATIQDSDEILKQIKVKATPTQDGTMCVFVTNESESVIDELQVQINYKDESGTTIDVQEDGHDMVLPGSTVVSRIDTPTSYKDFEIVNQIEIGIHSGYENHAQQIEMTSKKGEEGIIVELTNNAEISIDEVELIAVLYKGKDIVEVTYPTDIMNIQAGQKVTEKIDTFDTEYDRFEIYLNQAHTFGI